MKGNAALFNNRVPDYGGVAEEDDDGDDDADDTDDDDGDDNGDDNLYFVKGRSSRLPARLLLLGKGKGPDSDKKERKLVQKVQKVETTTFPADKIRDFV